MGTWYKTNPNTDISYASSTEVTASDQWNSGAIHVKIRTARGDGDTYYVRVYVKYDYGPGSVYTKTKLYYRIGGTNGDQAGYNMNDVGNADTFYYVGSRAAEAPNGLRVRIGLNSGMSSSVLIDKNTKSLPAAKYTVTYNGNGASYGYVAPGTHTYDTAYTTAGNGFSKTGYTFAGWNTAANGSGTLYMANTVVPNTRFPNQNVTLYAQWAINTYTVSYDPNGGAGDPADQTKTYGVNLTLSSVVPTRAGYSFLSWNTSQDGSGTSYQPGATYSTNAPLALYAQWATVVYTVTLDDDGSVTTMTKAAGASVTLPTLSKTGYNFLGWDTSPDASTAVYAPGASYSADADITLYAVWQKADLPIYIEINGTVHKIEKAYIKINGTVEDCDVYIKINGAVQKLE